MPTDLFGSLPKEVISYIISLYPKRIWFLLSKSLNDVAFEAMDDLSKSKALQFACRKGWMHIIEKCLKVTKPL
jgi:hypothetical protein